MTEENRHQFIDCVREGSCKDRREGCIAVCKERHLGVGEKILGMDKKMNLLIAIVAIDFLGLAYKIFFAG